MPEAPEPTKAETSLPSALDFAYLEKGKEGAFVEKAYTKWREHYNVYEFDDARRNWRHFRLESDNLDEKRAYQKEHGKTSSTFYTPVICPAILTRVSIFADTIVQQDPLVRFIPSDGADLKRVAAQETQVNRWLSKDKTLLKEVERLIDQEIYKYSATKIYLTRDDEVEYVTPRSGEIITRDGSKMSIDALRMQYAALASAAGLPQELPDEVLEQYIARVDSFRRKPGRLRPTQMNIPNGRFIYDTTQNDKPFWQYAGDIEMVSYVWLRENARGFKFDKKRLDRLEMLIKQQTKGIQSFQDFHWDVTENDSRPNPQTTNYYLALCEMYAKVIENDEVRVKRIHTILNVSDTMDGKKSPLEQPFVLSDPDDSPFELVDFPYVLGYTYKVPHSMMGIPTADLGADNQDETIVLRNLQVDQARYTVFNPILKRTGVRVKGGFKVEPGHINEMSEIGENAIRTLNLSQGNPGDMATMVQDNEQRGRVLMAAVDTLQGVTPGNPDEPLGSIKARRESGITRLNLTGLYVGDTLVQIAEMFRDMGAQIAKRGMTIYVGNEAIKLTSADFLESSTAHVMNIMRLASHQDRLVKAKEQYNMITSSPLIQQKASLTGDFTAVWEAMHNYLAELGVKNIEQIIGSREEAAQLAPPPQAPAAPSGPPQPQPGAPAPQPAMMGG